MTRSKTRNLSLMLWHGGEQKCWEDDKCIYASPGSSHWKNKWMDTVLHCANFKTFGQLKWVLLMSYIAKSPGGSDKTLRNLIHKFVKTTPKAFVEYLSVFVRRATSMFYIHLHANKHVNIIHCNTSPWQSDITIHQNYTLKQWRAEIFC